MYTGISIIWRAMLIVLTHAQHSFKRPADLYFKVLLVQFNWQRSCWWSCPTDKFIKDFLILLPKEGFPCYAFYCYYLGEGHWHFTYYITVLHIFHRMFPSVADGGHLLPALSWFAVLTNFKYLKIGEKLTRVLSISYSSISDKWINLCPKVTLRLLGEG